MSASEWPQFLSNPHVVEELFDTPPDLASCDLFCLHIDERDTGITLGFELAGLPDHPPEEWTGKGLNAFEFYITFTKVGRLRVDGWHGTPTDSVRIKRNAAGGIEVELRGVGDLVQFDARSAEVTRTRAYLAARPE